MRDWFDGRASCAVRERGGDRERGGVGCEVLRLRGQPQPHPGDASADRGARQLHLVQPLLQLLGHGDSRGSVPDVALQQQSVRHCLAQSLPTRHPQRDKQPNFLQTSAPRRAAAGAPAGPPTSAADLSEHRLICWWTKNSGNAMVMQQNVKYNHGCAPVCVLCMSDTSANVPQCVVMHAWCVRSNDALRPLGIH